MQEQQNDKPLVIDKSAKEEDYEEDETSSPFYGLEKGGVLQEARLFNEQRADPRKCQQILTKLLYLLNQGETLTEKEVTDIFFSITKLFQLKDQHLRRLVYLSVKEIAQFVPPGHIIIIISSLFKDMTSKTELFKSNAIRVICKIIDPQLLQQFERQLKNAIVDQSPAVSSAVLVGGLQLFQQNQEIIRRWISETQEASKSSNPMVQCHALQLLYQIRKNDRVSISKMVNNLIRQGVNSGFAKSLLIRYIVQVLKEIPPQNSKELVAYLDTCLKNKSEMVIFESCRTICNLKEGQVSSQDLSSAIMVLQLFLSSSKPVVRFAAIRTLNKIAQHHPSLVASCNVDMEQLIQDPNRSIATLAITTLLKTSNESSIDKLLKQIWSFVSEISDEFKIQVVQAVKRMITKYPHKHKSLLSFLSNILREEGGFDLKKSVVETILQVMDMVPEAKDPALMHLCDFIEDCEFPYLQQQILYLLGQEGPKCEDPQKFLRYIYNRTILEQSIVRAAATSALAKFGESLESLRPSIIILLQRCLYDNDDEVRDRATMYLKKLQEGFEIPTFVNGQLGVPLANLEAALQQYIKGGATSKPFLLDQVSQEVPESELIMAKKLNQQEQEFADEEDDVAMDEAEPQKVKGAEEYRQLFEKHPRLQQLGEIFSSTSPLLLTEEDTEYSVSVVKHIVKDFVVIQFACKNTIKEQILEDVGVSLDLADSVEAYEEADIIHLKSMPYEVEGYTFTILKAFDEMAHVQSYSLPCTLKFTVKEIDPTTGEAEEEGYDEEYPLNAIDLGPNDFLKAQSVPNFKKAWDEMGGAHDKAEEYSLGAKNGGVTQAVEEISGVFNLAPCEGSDTVAGNARSHTLMLAGVFVGNKRVLVRQSFGIDKQGEVAMKVVARSVDSKLSDLILKIVETA